MTEQQHPIMPPKELIDEWRIESYDSALRPGQLFPDLYQVSDYLYQKIAQWGWQQRDATVPQERQEAADQELDACHKWVKGISSEWTADCLRDARRPKSKSQAEEALEALCSMQIKPVIIGEINVNKEVMDKYEIIRRALERFREHEQQQQENN